MIAKTVAMEVVRPPAAARLRFWVLGLRVQPQHRPWVAEQITDPRFGWRACSRVLLLQLVLVVAPQTALALAEHSRVRLLIVAFVGLCLLIALVFRRPMTAAQRDRLLAYHGVTASGALRPPVSMLGTLGTNPLGRAGLVLLSAQVLLFSSGVAVAVDMISEQRRCKPVSAADLVALVIVLGKPQPGGFGPAPLVPAGSALVAARRVDSPLAGLHFVGAYVRTPTGALLGPAVWRVIEPGGVFAARSLSLDAQDGLARQLTPSTGYGGSSPTDPALRTARACARAAKP